ncbi:hypothetical protein BJ165DRAFT_1345224, partial [Panaeolus papilionaceus]
GNAAFKAADYPTAIGHYTDAILSDRKDPTYPLNRAAAYLKLGKFADAERDCSIVLELSANNVKALFRRGQARFGLDQLENAKNDPSPAPSTKVPSPPKQEPPAAFTNFAASLNNGDSTVKAIPPAKFPELCSSSLESPLLVDILRVFSTVLKSPAAGDNVKGAIMDYLVNFTKIKRFNTLLLFFIPSEKALAREVWELLGKRPEGVWASVA